jgi:hypothetical protein
MSDLALWLAGGLDAVALAERLGVHPDPWQEKVLRSTAPRLHLNCSRQVGKSTVTAILALHKALYTAGSTILIISPTDRQSGELHLKCTGYFERLGKTIEPAQQNVHQLVLENGSRILSLPSSESGVRGYTVDLLAIDEAAYVSDELFQSVSPMLAVSQGRCIAMSTPAGMRGWWWEASRSEHWEHVKVPASQCPRISVQFLAEERERLGENSYLAEFENVFTAGQGAAFSGEDIAAVFAALPANPEAAPVLGAPTRGLLSPSQRPPWARVRRGPAAAAERHPGRRNCQHRWQNQTKADGESVKVCRFCSREEPCQ